jgi:hypothetical protein
MLRRGERLMLFTRNSEPFSRLAWPVKLTSRAEGGLDPAYWSGVERAFAAAQELPSARLQGDRQGTPRPLDGVSSQDSTFMLAATVELRGAKAVGLAFGRSEHHPGFVAQLSVEGNPRGEVSLAPRGGPAVQKRHWSIRRGGVHKLRLVAVEQMVDVYVDDVLVINRCVPELRPGGLGVTVRDGEASFTSIQYRRPR